jgi:hypothetical protein
MDERGSDSGGAFGRSHKEKNLTNEQRTGILQKLLQHTKEGQYTLKQGALKLVATKCGVTPLTVSQIWRRAKEQQSEGRISVDVSSHKKKNSGRKKKNYAANLARIPDTPLDRRGTI